MNKRNAIFTISSLFASGAIVVSCLLLHKSGAFLTKGITPNYQVSETLYASDVAEGLSSGNQFTKGVLTFDCLNVTTDGNKIVFKGLDNLGNDVADNPYMKVLTGSVPSVDGSLSGQGFTNVEITGFNGEGYGQLGINSFYQTNENYIGYIQFLPKENQTVSPKTTDEKPMANYISIHGKAGLDLSITSITFYWECAATQEDPEPPEPTDKYLGQPYIKFNGEQADNDLYLVKHGYSNGGMFKSFWNRDNLTINEGIAGFSLTDDLYNAKNYGAEIKSTGTYQYGYFGGRMKAFSKAGTVQSIFTYNGGDVDHDEIDIEFLGKDTTKVQFNYYDDGVGSHEYLYDLGFDASKEFHEYGFKWEANKITWYVDFVKVYEVEATVEQAGYFHANVWAGNNDVEGISDWLGEYVADNNTYTAYYDYLSYSPLEASPAVAITAPKANSTVETVDKAVRNYINAFRQKGATKENDYLFDIDEVNTTNHTPRVSSYTVGKDVSKGKPVTVSFETQNDGPYKVYLSKNSDFSQSEIVETNEREASFYNLFIATDYYVKVITKNTKQESSVFKFTTSDHARLIYTSLTTNIRDIGGKITRSGKRVKQGLIYRGQELVQEAYTDSSDGNHVKTLDSDSLNTLVNELGIGLELDFRSNTELEDPNNLVSPLGVNYWHGSSVTSSGWVPSYNYISRDTNNLKMYKAIFQQFLQAETTPIYFHCWGGLDRTGTVAFILEGLLGVSFTDMCIDYELSSFSGSGALRQRDVDYQSGGKGMKTMVTQLVNNSAKSDKYAGYNPDGTNDIQEICENILLKAGMTAQEINQLRNILLED